MSPPADALVLRPSDMPPPDPPTRGAPPERSPPVLLVSFAEELFSVELALAAEVEGSLCGADWVGDEDEDESGVVVSDEVNGEDDVSEEVDDGDEVSDTVEGVSDN